MNDRDVLLPTLLLVLLLSSDVLHDHLRARAMVEKLDNDIVSVSPIWPTVGDEDAVSASELDGTSLNNESVYFNDDG